MLSFSEAHAQQQYGFRIHLKDKVGALPLSFSASFLSERSLARRVVQVIDLDESDRPVSPDYLSDILATTNGKFHVSSRWMNTCVVLLEDSNKVLQLNGKPYIDSIKYIAHYSAPLHNRVHLSPKEEVSPQSPANAQMRVTGTQAYYGSAYGQTALVNGDYLHDRDYTGKCKLIAVLDNGFSGVNTLTGFDSLNQNGRLLDQYNFVLHRNDVFSDRYNHGTSALSTMAANMPGNYVGTAPGAEYVVYVTEDDASEMPIELDNLIAGVERADSVGADIISVSLGYNEFAAPFTGMSYTYTQLDGKTTIVAKAANIAAAKGILFAASAGNEGSSTWNYILTPGDADSAITVGSVDLKGVMAPSSSYGPNAAGVIKPDICMVGNPAIVLTTGNNPVGIGGTSFALPQLAGWAACLWQSKPTATPFMIKDAIVRSASNYSNPGNHIGYGIPDFKLALQYLDVKDVPVIPTSENLVTVSPNPFENELDVKVYHAKTGDILLRVVDATGKELYKEKYNRLAGIQHLPVSFASGLIPGVYYLTVISAGNTATLPILKK
ncbi:MAG: T9SS type A sorting domain-containing protein [Sphingobacteriales bacterium]|nr:MAG: T9SS type A sorting domain-containing protein [Sphingobacteriales bacterium]